MFLLASDLDSVPAEFIKYTLVVLGWLATTGAALYGGTRMAKKGTKESPVAIEQPLNVQKHDAAARRSEVDKIEGCIRKMTERFDSFAEQVNAQFAAMTKAGQDRAAAITQNIDEEVSTLSIKIGELADALHEKINQATVNIARHGAEIDGLKAGEYRHNQEIARIQEHIADLLARPKR